jgi:hypothetical protein
MHYLVLVLGLVLVGCQLGPVEEKPIDSSLSDISAEAPTVVNNTNFVWETVSEETDAYSMSYPNFTEGLPRVIETINADLPGGMASFVRQAESWAAEVKNDPELEMHRGWELHVDPGFLYEDETFASIALNTYEDTGGAHGNFYYGVINYHLPSDSFVTLENLLSDPKSLVPIADWLRQELILQKTARTEDYSPEGDTMLEEGTRPDFVNFKTWHFVDGPEGRGLMFLFAPYQVGPWATGSFAVLMPVGLLSDYIKPEFQDWFTAVPATSSDYIGMNETEAAALAKERNVLFRVVERDGQPLPATMDWRPGRINASVSDGIVTGYTVEGE